MTTVARKYWTDEEILALPNDGHKREIVFGELVMMSPAGFDHGELIGRFVHELGKVVYDRQLGSLADGQTGFRLSSGDLFCPDISFVTTARVALQRSKRAAFFQGAPDLIVEVLSPFDTMEVMEEKLAQFFAAGMKLAWIVHPRTRSIHVYRSLSQSAILTADQILDGEDVIPGFTLKISNLFR